MAEYPSNEPVLPCRVASLLREIDKSHRHPGLQLDKFSLPGKQEVQKREIAAVCRAEAASELLLKFSHRRTTMLAAIAAERFRAITEGPLTLHLARTSGLENAGIHLHPVYGFACLPGSGLKGMARAWAETVWLANQENPADAWGDIRTVFGWARRSEKDKHWRPQVVGEPDGSSSGSIVFHDAWPTNWPRLEPDIVNNHHKNYYKGEDDPGDWDDPEMAYFISVAVNTTFDFALSPRLGISGCGSKYMALAKEWLQAALVHEGVGAKTSTGYGRFRLEADSQPKISSAARRISTHTLELSTPAFLAGAAQGKEDCDLRPASIRGQLRWWWRTMHSAHLNHKDILRLETAIWGDAKTSGALALSIRPEKPVVPQEFDKSQITKHHAEPKSQGIRYAAYGMDEAKSKRWYIEPGMRWVLTLYARQSRLPENGPFIEAADVLWQGHIALWLLCRFGGIGSKSRNGFGSFLDIEVNAIESVKDCIEAGALLRKATGLTGVPYSSSKSSSLDNILELEFPTPWQNHWFALDQIGCAMQSFAQKYKNNARKDALGLPRKNRRSGKHPIYERVASPVHYHLARDRSGALIVRLTAFPSPVLPDIKTSQAVLTELKRHIASELKYRAGKRGDGGKSRTANRPPTASRNNSLKLVTPLPSPGDRVEAVLLEKRTKKGGWKAKHEPTGLQGPIHNTAEVPDEVAANQQVPLIVAHANQRGIAFNWPTPEIERRRSKSGERQKRPRGRA